MPYHTYDIIRMIMTMILYIIVLTMISYAVSYIWYHTHDNNYDMIGEIYDIIARAISYDFPKAGCLPLLRFQYSCAISYDMENQYHIQYHIWYHIICNDIIGSSRTPNITWFRTWYHINYQILWSLISNFNILDDILYTFDMMMHMI